MPPAVRERCDSPLFRQGALVPQGASVQPALLARGLRSAVLDAGVTLAEQTRVRRIESRSGDVLIETDDGASVRAGAAVLAINAASAGVAPLRPRLAVTSTHMIVTEPVPDLLERDRLDRGRVHLDRTPPSALLPHHRRRADRLRLGRRALGLRGAARRQGRGRSAGGRAPPRGHPAIFPRSQRAPGRRGLGRAGRRLPDPSSGGRHARGRAGPLRVRVHRQRRRSGAPGRRDPGVAGARPRRFADAIGAGGAAAAAGPARARPLHRRHPGPSRARAGRRTPRTAGGERARGRGS